MNTSTLLAGMPEGVQSQRLIPWSAAMRVVTPLIQTNDPVRAHALPLFENWIADRDQDISIARAAWLWDHFWFQFTKEMPWRALEWMESPLSKELKSPVMLGRLVFRIWLAVHLAPLKARMQQTILGRVGYRLLQGVGYLALFSIIFPIAMVLVGMVAWVLIEIREPLRSLMGLQPR